MSDNFFEELDKGFGDMFGPITDPEERISGPDSAEFIERLRNTFLALGVLSINLSDGLEAEHNELL